MGSENHAITYIGRRAGFDLFGLLKQQREWFLSFFQMSEYKLRGLRWDEGAILSDFIQVLHFLKQIS